MAKGYVYIMTSAIDGLIKIGKSKDWNRRCKDELESNGYKNINALKTYFVVECDDYDEIESIMHDIFRESRVSNIEAFAVDKDRAKRILSKLGKQVYPEVNNVSASVKSASPLAQYYANFWALLTVELDNRPNIDSLSVKGHSDNRIYYTGRHFNLPSKWHVSVDIRKNINKLNVHIATRNSNVFNYLQIYQSNKAAIEKELGYSLIWNDKYDTQDINKIKRISYYIDYNIDINKPIDPKIIKTVADKLIELQTVFSKY